MGDLFGGLAPVGGSEAKKTRGRPKGARNKASGDLAKFFAHMTDGLTPGQQMASLVAVTPRDIREARKWFKDQAGKNTGRGILDIKAFDPVALGQIYKTQQLAILLGWPLQDAWSLMAKVQNDLMPFVHQKQAATEPEKADKRAVILVDDAALGSIGNPSQVVENEQELLFGPMPLTQPGSHNAPETVVE